MDVSQMLDKKPINVFIRNEARFDIRATEIPQFLVDYNYNFRDGGPSTYTHIENHTDSHVKLCYDDGTVTALFRTVRRNSNYQNIIVVRRCQIRQCDDACTFYALEQEAWYSPEQFAREPLYDSFTNIVIGHVNADDIQHPYICRVSKEYVGSVIEELKVQINTNSITVMANDPTGSIDKLYYIMNGRTCQVNVTHLPNEAAFIRMQIASARDDGKKEFTTFDLDELKAGKCKFDTVQFSAGISNSYHEVAANIIAPHEWPMFIGVSKLMVERTYQHYLQELLTNKDAEVVRKDYEERIKNIEKEHAEQMSQLRNAFEDEKRKLQSTINLHEERQKRAEELEKEQLHVRQTESQERQLKHKTQSSIYSMVGSALKVAVIAIPIAIGIAKFFLSPVTSVASLCANVFRILI